MTVGNLLIWPSLLPTGEEDGRVSQKKNPSVTVIVNRPILPSVLLYTVDIIFMLM